MTWVPLPLFNWAASRDPGIGVALQGPQPTSPGGHQERIHPPCSLMGLILR